MKKIHLSEITIYPVKSCKGVLCQNLLISNKGLHMDRRWMVVDEQGVFLSQRTCPDLAKVHAGLDNRFLFLSVPGQSPLMIPQNPSGEPCEVTIWQARCKADDMGDVAAEWLSSYLKRKCRLVFLPEEASRINKAGTDMGFADRMPVHLISESSLQDLNSRVSMRVRMNRFRPNFVVSGCAPYEEDTWKRIKIGDIHFRVEKPCVRCVVPTINQETVEKNNDVLQALAQYRKDDNGITFGQLLVPENTGTISHGAEIEVLDHS